MTLTRCVNIKVTRRHSTDTATVSILNTEQQFWQWHSKQSNIDDTDIQSYSSEWHTDTKWQSCKLTVWWHGSVMAVIRTRMMTTVVAAVWPWLRSYQAEVVLTRKVMMMMTTVTLLTGDMNTPTANQLSSEDITCEMSGLNGATWYH